MINQVVCLPFCIFGDGMNILAEKIHKLIEESRQLAIIMHQNPDGDAMGSALALYEYITSLNISCKVFSPTSIASVLDWMPHRKSILLFDPKNKMQKEYLDNADSVIFVDHSSENQSGIIFDYLNISEKKTAFIDHHPFPSIPVDIAYSVTDSAAACCVTYQIFKIWGIKPTPTMATCLYTGICTDTGNFKYGNNLSEAFQIASELINLGIDQKEIIYSLFYNSSVSSLKLLGFVLSKKMKLISSKVAYISLTKEELLRYNIQQGDTDDIVNYPLKIKDINISAIFIEREDCIKISFRSKGNSDVSKIARDFFNGGGHRNASGGRFYGTMEEAINEYIKQI